MRSFPAVGREEEAPALPAPPAPPVPRPPASSPFARRTPARADRGSAGPGPRGQLSAVRPRLKGPAREGRRRRRLQEVRATAQREAAEGTAERGHGWGDEEVAPAAPAAGVPRPGCCSHSNCREAPASEPALDPTSRLLEPSTPGRQEARRDLLCVESSCRKECWALQSLQPTNKMPASS